MSPNRVREEHGMAAPAGTGAREGESAHGMQGGGCVGCGSRSRAVLFEKGGRDFVRCRSCGLVWLDPLPTPEELDAHYERSYREGGYSMFAAATDIRRGIADDRLARARTLSQGTRWLDVGCAGGDFLDAARDAGLAAEGIDLSSEAVRRARARGLTAHHARFEDFAPERPYETVTAFDLIEHTRDPRAFLRTVNRWLMPRGTLVLTLPDVGSIYPRLIMRRHWFYYAPNEHLFYFNRRTITRLLTEEGFRVTRIGRSYKRLTLSYSAKSLSIFNRTLGSIATRLAAALPEWLAERRFPLYLGEMWVEAVKEPR
jgi:2-polyprenyl-3-methyl-5-hydroxy-6-metoxy-1,4-benzoquinol methylase